MCFEPRTLSFLVGSLANFAVQLCDDLGRVLRAMECTFLAFVHGGTKCLTKCFGGPLVSIPAIMHHTDWEKYVQARCFARHLAGQANPTACHEGTIRSSAERMYEQMLEMRSLQMALVQTIYYANE
jgi:hypothetical protein